MLKDYISACWGSELGEDFIDLDGLAKYAAIGDNKLRDTRIKELIAKCRR